MTSLSELNSAIKLCRDCPELASNRTQVVPGEGPERAGLLFLGEAPGWHEDHLGRPFVGPAGQLLDKLIASVGLQRGEVYITNIIKCRPPDNRDPLPREIASCRKWLDQQLQLIQPQVVITLGRHSLAQFFPSESIGKLHGTWRHKDGRLYFAMYHPAAALHQQSLRKTIEEDMKKLPFPLGELEKEEKKGEEPQQLALF